MLLNRCRNVLKDFTCVKNYLKISKQNYIQTPATSTINVNENVKYHETHKVTLIPGDGIGTELTYALQDVVKSTGIPLKFIEIFLSEIHYSRSASLDDVVESIKSNNNVAIKGHIQHHVSNKHDMHDVNMSLKNKLDLFASLVHIKNMKGIKTRHSKELDFYVIREQLEGEYKSLEHELVPGVVESLKISTTYNSDRIAKFAFDFATRMNRKKVTVVHKANIMKLSDGLFLNSCKKISRLYPKIELESMIVDNCCMQLVSRPEQFDVMVTPNLYGNIVDSLAVGLVGGAGIARGQSIGSDSVIFEPAVRYPSQDALGRQIANPTAILLCCVDLLNHLYMHEHASALKISIEKVLSDGIVKTRDLGGYSSTNDFVNAVIDNFKL